ncbi:MAG: DUF1295 domain-containing protein [Candidatus Eremiobacteraeota bacterium]|nr:DUF1295 domain-containing protein [Candidatus Eremiobacteraeota bacterium]
MTETLLYAGAAVFLYMLMLFIVATAIRNNSIADVGWGGGFIIVALISFFHGGRHDLRQTITTVMIVAWGLRLVIHLSLRNRGKPEDRRYAKWRESWGKWAVPRAFVHVFLAQGALLLLISYPVILINTAPGPELTAADVMGFALWIAGFALETIADRQLADFRRDPSHRGKICQEGLWKYSRHPNYFGEALTWWGIYLVALPVPGGWKAVFSPLIITLLLRYVSGVPLLEAQMSTREGYEEYRRTTPVFIPGLPLRRGDRK